MKEDSQEKSDFDIYKKKYNNYRILEYSIYGVSGLLALNYVRILKKQRKVHRPVYNQGILLSKIDFNLSPTFVKNGWMCALSMKF